MASSETDRHHADLEAALERFEGRHARYDRAGTLVAQGITAALASEGVSVRVTHRVKDTASYRAKVELKRAAGDEKYNDPWDSVTDKVGVRVLVERQRDVDRVHRAIADRTSLAILDTTDKRTELALEELGYSGLHLDVDAPAEAEDDEVIRCEIQIRTVAQDAWSVVSHKLLYKPSVELPLADRRALMRLVALVELFDEEVERVSASQGATSTSTSLDLISLAAAQYARFRSNQYSVQLSAAVMEAIAGTLDDEALAAYPATLEGFVAANHGALMVNYDQCGTGSPMVTSPDYLLWSQPESIMILERLEVAGHALLHEWDRAKLPRKWLRSLATATDFRIPE